MLDDAKIAAAKFLQSDSTGFGKIGPEAELLMPVPEGSHHSVAETWWFDVTIPEKSLVCSFYISIRRNLGTCAAGVWMWKGFKRHQLQADHLNFQTFCPHPVIEGSKISVPTVNLAMEILQPFQSTKITYESPDSSTVADLIFESKMPAAVRGNNLHFEQGLWVTGNLKLNGEEILVDHPGFRDRSWGEARPEEAMPIPPIGWLCGVFDNGNAAFNLSGFDDPELGCEWQGDYDITEDRLLNDGWLFLDGELRKVVKMKKRTNRVPFDRMRPSAVEVFFEDDRGESHHLVGEILNGYGMHHWPKVHAYFALTKWILNGDIVGYGETQDYVWPDYATRYWR